MAPSQPQGDHGVWQGDHKGLEIGGGTEKGRRVDKYHKVCLLPVAVWPCSL